MEHNHNIITMTNLIRDRRCTSLDEGNDSNEVPDELESGPDDKGGGGIDDELENEDVGGGGGGDMLLLFGSKN